MVIVLKKHANGVRKYKMKIHWDEELKVKNFIKSVEEEKIFLPEFQRPFVWEKSQIRLLIDSIYNNYTINSVLFWQGGDELARRRVGGNIREIRIPKKGSSEKITYLLDGQQRATALMLVFTDKKVYKGKNTQKSEKVELYFDSEYDGDDPELRFIFDDDLINYKNEEILLKNLSQREIIEKFGSRFIRLKDCYFLFKKESYKFLKEKIEDKDLLLDYHEKIQKLKENILDRKVYDIDQKGELKEVLDVFERINTKNTKLNIFDIMVAKTYRMLDDTRYFSLRDFLSMVKNNSSVSQDYLENLQKLDLNGLDNSIDEVTMLFLILVILKKKFKQKEVLGLTTDHFLDNLKEIHDIYLKVLHYMEKYKVDKEDVSKFKPILKFLTAYLSENKTLEIKQEKFLEKWFWNTILYNRYPGAQNEKVEKDFVISKKNDEDQALEKYKKDRTRNFNSNYLDAHYEGKNQLYNSLFVLLLNNNPLDFYNGIDVKKKNLSQGKLEEHHIFPKNSKTGKIISESLKDSENPDLINNLANIALITKETNNKRIKKKDPKEYILDFEKEYKKEGLYDDFLKIMKSQFISEEMIEMLKENKFDEFIIARTRLIKDKIGSLCD